MTRYQRRSRATAEKTIPRLAYSKMTDRWYILTRYKELGDGRYEGQTKYDITDQIREAGLVKMIPSEICGSCSYPRLRPDLITK